MSEEDTAAEKGQEEDEAEKLTQGSVQDAETSTTEKQSQKVRKTDTDDSAAFGSSSDEEDSKETPSKTVENDMDQTIGHTDDDTPRNAENLHLDNRLLVDFNSVLNDDLIKSPAGLYQGTMSLSPDNTPKKDKASKGEGEDIAKDSKPIQDQSSPVQPLIEEEGKKRATTATSSTGPEKTESSDEQDSAVQESTVTAPPATPPKTTEAKTIVPETPEGTAKAPPESQSATILDTPSPKKPSKKVISGEKDDTNEKFFEKMTSATKAKGNKRKAEEQPRESPERRMSPRNRRPPIVQIANTAPTEKGKAKGKTKKKPKTTGKK